MTAKTSPKPDYIPLSGIPETPDERAARIRHEAAIIAKAHADIDAGLGYEFEEVEAFLDQLEIDPNTKLPQPKTPIQKR